MYENLLKIFIYVDFLKQWGDREEKKKKQLMWICFVWWFIFFWCFVVGHFCQPTIVKKSPMTWEENSSHLLIISFFSCLGLVSSLCFLSFFLFIIIYFFVHHIVYILFLQFQILFHTKNKHNVGHELWVLKVCSPKWKLIQMSRTL